MLLYTRRRMTRAITAAAIFATSVLVGFNATAFTAAAAPSSEPAAGVVSNPGMYDPVPAGGAEYVAFGDSYAANPSIVEQYENRPDGDPCRWGSNSYPMRIAHRFASFYNATCSGAVISEDYFHSQPVTANMAQLVDRAERAHALGPDTKVVTITVGGNEAWLGVRDYGHLGSWRMITAAEFAQRIGPTIERIRALAPATRILFVGYPEFVGSDNQLCYVDTSRYHFPLRVMVIDPVQRAYMMAINHAMAESAPGFGAEYVDVFGPSQGHGSCTPDDQRWVKTLFDAPEHDKDLWLHLNEAGTTAQARIIEDYLDTH